MAVEARQARQLFDLILPHQQQMHRAARLLADLAQQFQPLHTQEMGLIHCDQQRLCGHIQLRPVAQGGDQGRHIVQCHLAAVELQLLAQRRQHLRRVRQTFGIQRAKIHDRLQLIQQLVEYRGRTAAGTAQQHDHLVTETREMLYLFQHVAALPAGVEIVGAKTFDKRVGTEVEPLHVVIRGLGCRRLSHASLLFR